MIHNIIVSICVAIAIAAFITWLCAVYANEQSGIRRRLWFLEILISTALAMIPALTTRISKDRKLVSVVLIFFAMIGAFQGTRVFLDREKRT